MPSRRTSLGNCWNLLALLHSKSELICMALYLFHSLTAGDDGGVEQQGAGDGGRRGARPASARRTQEVARHSQGNSTKNIDIL
jgi:hypothetical protein